MNILVTGCKGQLGTELRKIASTEAIHQWFFTDIDSLDICNETAVNLFFRCENIEVCINCAAYTAVDKAEDEPDLARKANALAPQILANACMKNNALLVQISTDYVFDGQSEEPYREDVPINPCSVYGKTKAEGEHLIKASGCKYIIIRTAWLYSATGKNFVKTMLALAEKQKSINVVNDQKGTPTWAFDLAVAIMNLVDNIGTNEIHEIYHFTNEGIATWYDFAKAIMEISGLETEIVPICSKDFPFKAIRPNYSVLDKTKYKKETKNAIPFWRNSLIKALDELNRKKS
jgi:dTDP-4-dehydrorhamnose reductase